MNQEDLLNVIGEATEEMLERSEKKTVPVKRIVFAAVAACLALVLALSVFVPWIEIVTQRRHVVTESRYMPEMVYSSEEDNSYGCFAVTHNQAFINRVVVEAKLTRKFTDIYANPSGMYFGYLENPVSRMAVLEMQTVDVIVGENVPKVFYVAIAAEQYEKVGQYYDSYENFDSFIVGMRQMSLGDYSLVNTETKMVERFGTFFLAEGMIPFKNGRIEGKVYPQYSCHCYSSSAECFLHDYTSKGALKKGIKELSDAESNDYHDYRMVNVRSSLSAEGKKAYDYVMNPANGTFLSSGNYDTQGVIYYFFKLVNGYPSSETITINTITGEVRYTECMFGAEEEKNMPDLFDWVEQSNICEEIKVPGEPENTTKREVSIISCWYCKTKDGVAAVRISLRVYCETKEGYVFKEGISKVILPDGTYVAPADAGIR